MTNIHLPLMQFSNRSSWNKQIKTKFDALQESQYYDEKTIRERQFNKLKVLLTHAFQHTEFYRNRFNEIGKTPDDITCLEDITMIPPLEREDLNHHLDSILATSIPKDQIHFASTGGSTGLSTKFARDNTCLDIKKASEYRFNSFTGWRPGEKILYYWPALKDFAKTPHGQLLFRRKHLDRQIQLYAGRLNKAILAEHCMVFRRFRPALVRAFPNSLEIFAEYLKDRKVTIPVKRGIICVGEPLNELQRRLFQKVFECDVFNCYVSREAGNIACECSAHRGLHVADELLFIETNCSEKTETGEIMITDLENYGMPLIRYRIQDASKWQLEKCPCGRNLHKIELNAARVTDYLISPHDGSIISGSSLVHYLLAESGALRVGRSQIVQDARDHILVKLTGDSAANEDTMNHISRTLGQLFHDSMKVDFHFVDEIPFLQSGKYRFVLRTFEPNSLNGHNRHE